MRQRLRSLILASMYVLLVTLLLFAASAVGATPQEDPSVPLAPHGGSPCDGDGVYLYEDIDYGGDCIKFTSDDSDFIDDGWNDKVSSIRIVGWPETGYVYSATLYEHINYVGTSSQFTADDPCLGDDAIGNDRASSMQVWAVPLCDLVTQIPNAECEALVDLYNSTNGASWLNHAGWLANDAPCSWHGVQCYGGHVIKLYCRRTIYPAASRRAWVTCSAFHGSLWTATN